MICENLLSAMSDESPEPDSIDDAPAPPSPDNELDGVRIKQLAALRRATYRSRSYAIIAAAACAVTIGQLGWMIFRQLRGRLLDRWLALESLLLLAAAYGLWAFARRVAALNRELQRTPASEPPRPAPDFSALSNGSQQWKNLENVE